MHSIVATADDLPDPPYKALFQAYDLILAENNISPDHDGVIFRALLRVGEQKSGATLMERLRAVLQAAGIEIQEAQDDGQSVDITRDFTRDVQEAGRTNGTSRGRRRVSFDAARLDETWLSQHSSPLRSPPARTGLLARPPQRGPRRARSSSSQRYSSHRQKHTAYGSEQEDGALAHGSTAEELEHYAEAFLDTSIFRASRRVFHRWHDRALVVQSINEQAHLIAEAHDQRVLLLQALVTWRAVTAEKVWNRKNHGHLMRLEEKARTARTLFVLTKSFTHWATSSRDQMVATRVARNHMLRIRYFHRWRTFAHEQAEKSRKILTKKHLAQWRSTTAHALVREEQAHVHYEESLMKQTYWKMFWTFCARRAPIWNQAKIKQRYLHAWIVTLRSRQELEVRANNRHSGLLKSRSLARWRTEMAKRQEDSQAATDQHGRRLLGDCFVTMTLQLRLQPLGRQMTLRVNLALMRKAFAIWSSHAFQLRQAASVDGRRLLQQTWTKWNDTLRINALAQRINERALVENLYRWVLAERLQLSRRTAHGRLLQRVVVEWRNRRLEANHRLNEASQAFAEGRERRVLLFGMRHFHARMWSNEEMDRRALESRNSHLLPTVLERWEAKTESRRQLQRWAADANFYRLTTHTLRIWRDKTTQHQKNRKRDAYATVRARFKIRVVRNAFTSWRARTAEVANLNGEAETRSFERLQRTAAESFYQWRTAARQRCEQEDQAITLDVERLLQSALAAFLTRSQQLLELNGTAVAFRAGSDQALTLGCLKRMQWRLFTVQRLSESSTALAERNKDQHLRLMLRSWARQSAFRRAAEDPPSPSLRAASRSATRSAPSQQHYSRQSPPRPQTTPAYLRTPSRSRRAARFRPLPTPAPMTPFKVAYSTTTPAPMQPGPDGLESLTPQVTPFARKLRAAGVTPGPSVLRTSVLGRSVGGTAKSVRFGAASRFGAVSVEDVSEEGQHS